MGNNEAPAHGQKGGGYDSPHLDEREKKQAEQRAPIGPLVIHEIIHAQGMEELERTLPGLVWSGLAAGLSVGFSFLTEATISSHLPQASWSPLLASFGYSIGFLIVILGQQQLFTETTLTALIPLLGQRSLALAQQTLRVWAAVLVANLVPTLLWGWVSARTNLFPDATRAAMLELSQSTMAHSFGHTFGLALIAGWIIGLMVWLLPAAGVTKPFIIVLLTTLVALLGTPHIIAGSAEAFFGVASGHASITDYFFRFMIPTLLGNTAGGTVLAALLNHAPIRDELKASD
ncbi:formate/nitrite transporter [Acetobacter nitrogenifigens DSM 23921 = NBRC 105050]|uniref:Formate transporter n=1 Tax=Acetobacter nitrogenifigens DSM 23921 = NBRC 105050 TaxID=1120919 RepID=A0A511XAK2_9PROT|nr:formate/nitrite transporter family protein [Acetobacter nitrogenifigens]GBQ91127.1 formate/nitrite transporter [Acetobacter nitrogenifigens DSM 23921 = NBRC 105050]GEN59988.1 hypothetical protein ANI02nite_18720 [Acetobacter nitrogenifigens DSM 23921 = NBRC 105050]